MVIGLVKRQVELEVLPACREYGLGFVCWSPLSAGLLAGPSAAKEGRRAQLCVSDDQRKNVDAYESFCRDRGESPAVIALAWLLHNPVVTAPIVGPRTMEQLESAARALDVDLGETDLAALDEIFPGPGGEAPMAYAW